MADRHILTLTKATLAKALQGVTAAANKGGWVLELRPARRTDEQNDALHGLIAQILKQRPFHCGIRMSKETYKAIFMHALGKEATILPNLDGDGVFPMGLSTSKLTVGEFSQLLESILAWTAREGIEVQHFDGREADRGQPGRRAA